MSGKINAAITGVAGYVPDFVLTNKKLEKMVDTTDEWITTRTGIKERRILVGENKGSTDLATPAVKKLLEKTGTDPLDVDLIICATVTADTLFPDNANTVAYRLGMKKAYGFDLSAACSGFLFALTTGAQFITSGKYKKVVVVGADKMSSIVDYTDRTTCVIFGDGGGAVLLEPDENGLGIQDDILCSDGAGADFLYQKAGGSKMPATHETVDAKHHYIYQDGRPVFKAAVKGMSEAVTNIINRNGLVHDDIRWLVPHQANMRIIKSVGDMIGFPQERVMVTIHKYGNTTAATIPLCLNDYESKISKGDYVVLTAFGGGYTWGATLLKWAY
jgi:3-oxoacyl-[acyl-carrier-protein] synthase-3